MTWDGLVLHASERAAASEPEAARVLAEAALAAGPGAFAPREAFDRWLARARFAGVGRRVPARPDDDGDPRRDGRDCARGEAASPSCGRRASSTR